jgi:predicted transcriptional regulator of viral defense system
MATIPWQAAEQGGAFTAEQALEAGWSRAALSRACAARRLERIRPGVYRRGRDSVDPGQASRNRLLDQALGAALKIPNVVISHHAAAIIHGLPLLNADPARPCLTVRPGRRVAPCGAHLHRVRLMPAQLRQVGALDVTSPARTCMDLARHSGLLAGLVPADHAIRVGEISRSELADVCASMRGGGGSAAARRLVELADGRHESPLETISGLHLSALPETPRPQVTLLGASGEFLARADFLWERLGVVGEADGRGKYSDSAELWREKRRADRLAEHGLVVARWSYHEATRPALLAATIQRAFDQAAKLRSAGILVTARIL